MGRPPRVSASSAAELCLRSHARMRYHPRNLTKKGFLDRLRCTSTLPTSLLYYLARSCALIARSLYHVACCLYSSMGAVEMPKGVSNETLGGDASKLYSSGRSSSCINVRHTIR